MPKRKDFLQDSKKKSKHTPSVPNTADEYLAAGVDFEEAGEKWRGGDAVKSTRFFVRAIDLYDEALKRFPQSFDLAYNKARVQYELTQHPKLSAQLPGPLVEVLQTALGSSRIALSLKPDNPDVLFNTAQCLTSLVEASSSERNSNQNPEQQFKCLEEAIELFQRCLSLQESNYEESQAQMQAHPDVEDQSSGSVINPSLGETDAEMDDVEEMVEEGGMAEDRWATIIEPVTVDTLLDTLIALLETMTAFCNLLTSNQAPSSKTLPWLEELSSNLLNTKLPAYLSIPSEPVPIDRTTEAFITRATFLAAFADTTFRAGNIDIQTYTQTVDSAFTYATLATTITSNPEGLCNKAEALITFNHSIHLISSSQSLSTPDIQPILTARWKALSTAITALTAASKLLNAENVVKIHLARGDVELFRYGLGAGPGEVYAPATKNAGTLLKNAATYYRGAAALARLDPSSWEEELKEGVVKEAVANEFAKGEKVDWTVWGVEGVSKEDIGRVLEDMVEEGLILL